MHVFYVFKAILVILINKVRAVLNLDDNLLETAGRSCLHFLVVLCSIFLAAPLKLRVQKSETQFKPIESHQGVRAHECQMLLHSTVSSICDVGVWSESQREREIDVNL